MPNIHTPDRRSGEESDMAGQVSWGQLLIGIIILLALPAVVLFGSSGRLDWDMAWVYVGLTAAFSLGSRIIILWKTPDLAAERGQASDKEDIEPWDKVLMPLGMIIATVMLTVAGLDKRFEWSPNLPLSLHSTAFVITALGYSLGTWATVANRFFSSVARIQREREHVVVTTGPYQYVRHPGYAGAIVTSLTTPLLLGSLWALIPAALAVCQLIIRTALEDRFLQDELEGYCDYATQVRYRLLPGVW
jgi:protein-S-isoprenylcysteine O-methyltransferase Ste14